MLLQRSRRIKKLTRGAQNVTLALTLLAAFTVTAQDTESALQRGEEFLRAGSYAAASEIFLQAQGVDREEGIVGASRAFAAMGNVAEAVRVCESALAGEAVERYPLVTTQLAELLRERGESARALAVRLQLQEQVGEFSPADKVSPV